MVEKYKRIDPANFDFSKARTAQDTGKVRADPAEEGQKIETIMQDGRVVSINTARKGDMIVVTSLGEQRLVGGEEFNHAYREIGSRNVYVPRAAPLRVVPLTENVMVLAPWGEMMKIRAGGVLARTGSGKIFGIQAEEFAATYSYVEIRNGPAARNAPKLEA